MQKSMKNVPPSNKEDVEKVVDIIKSEVPADKIILFGSYARGDFVSDRYREGHVVYEYQSDYDLLVVVRSEKLKNDYEVWEKVRKKIRADAGIKVPVSIIVDTVNFVNKKLSEGNYFYTDVVTEGVLLHDSGKVDFSEAKILTAGEKKDLAKKDYEFWIGKAEAFLRDYEYNVTAKEGSLNNAAFHLSQATEALYFAILLVFTGYKPKSHKLDKIEGLIIEFLPEIEKTFPRETDEEKRLFGLLRDAYIDARYKQEYAIEKKDLEYLRVCVKNLKDLVEKACKEKI